MSNLTKKIDAFALKSFVSILKENEKEKALSIVGGSCFTDPPYDPPSNLEDFDGGWLNIFDPDDKEEFDFFFDNDQNGEGIHEWFVVDENGFVLEWNTGSMGDGNHSDNNWSESEWKAWEHEHYGN